jgi:hypothetical protein
VGAVFTDDCLVADTFFFLAFFGAPLLVAVVFFDVDSALAGAGALEAAALFFATAFFLTTDFFLTTAFFFTADPPAAVRPAAFVAAFRVVALLATRFFLACFVSVDDLLRLPDAFGAAVFFAAAVRALDVLPVAFLVTIGCRP